MRMTRILRIMLKYKFVKPLDRRSEQQESAARPVCGSRSAATTKCSRPNGSPKGKRSAAKPSSPPSHPSLFDILLIFFNLPRKQYESTRKQYKNLRKQYKKLRTQYTAKIVFVPGIQCFTEKISSSFPHFPKDSGFPTFPVIPCDPIIPIKTAMRNNPNGGLNSYLRWD